MKKVYFILIFFISLIGFSQNGISYQALIINPSGEQLPGANNYNVPLSNKLICLKFSIIDSKSNLEYIETHTTTTDAHGIVNLIIGTGSQIGGYASTFLTILWNNTTKSLKVDLDVEASCSNFTEISNQPFTYVPFALYAANAHVDKATTTSTGVIKLAGDLGGTADLPTVPGLAKKENTITPGTTSQYWRGDKTWQTLDKSVVGLGNVDNTSDANKPVSSAAQTALNKKEDVANKSTNIDLGTSDVLYPTQNAVKTYVDSQLISGFALNNTPDATTTVKGKIKIAGDLGGTADLPTVPGLATKEPTITAGTTSQYWRGDKSWQTLDKTVVGLGNVDNTSDLNKPISNATATALDTKLDKTLAKPETITTTATNTLAIKGLQNETSSTYQILTTDPVTGEIRKINPSSVVGIHEVVYSTTANANQFTTPRAFSDISKVHAYRNGVRIGLIGIDTTHVQLEAGVVCDLNDEIRIVQYE
ncbi:hypothetical protein [Flavobacterium sp.]|uniref:hypothetical protein n=1 Tax=Flavobacterium sp. TaxID=239 RepID=UPI00260A39A8|nr:hypothetical protein [Flavobacterium sp.]